MWTMEMNSMGMGDGGMDALRTVLSLIIVIGMMLAVYYWLKRRGNMPGASQRRMRVLERVALDSRRSIVLLQIDDEEIVIGVGNDSINSLKVVHREVEHEA